MDAGYLVKYGRGAFVGRFVPPGGDAFDRGDRVRVRSDRGVELGTILCEAEARFEGRLGPSACGDLLGHHDGDGQTDSGERSHQEEAIRAGAERLAAESGLPLLVLDVEILLDGQAIVQAVRWDACDLDAFFERLSLEHQRAVKLLDDTRPAPAPTEAAGCGDPACGKREGGCSSCGDHGGGCSSGGCARGSLRSAGEVSAYFAGLRRQMDARAERYPLA